jgi:hypothetical protein
MPPYCKELWKKLRLNLSALDKAAELFKHVRGPINVNGSFSTFTL